jgi:hypothetical protein
VAALTCDAHVQWPGKPNRATIKPSVRAAVLARDRHRCATAGCRSTHFLEVHHVQPRSQGGSNRAENLITLCSRCHGFVHEGGGALAGDAHGQRPGTPNRHSEDPERVPQHLADRDLHRVDHVNRNKLPWFE